MTLSSPDAVAPRVEGTILRGTILRHIARALPLLLLAHSALAAPLGQKLAMGGEAEPPGLLRPAAARPAVRYRFEVSPKSGGAPLRVTFSTWVPGNYWAGNGRLLIDFGDGAQEIGRAHV